MNTSLSAEVVALIGKQGQTRLFTLTEATEALPVVQKLTASAAKELLPIQDRMGQLLDCDPRLPQIESGFEDIVRRWVAGVQRLGLKVSGLWEVGFDTGDGYLSWRHPEIRLAYFRLYGDDFQFRRPLSDVIEEQQPEWAFS